jgi:hypothetical protein
VIDAEIVEEGEDSTSSPEHQLQNLIDEVRKTRPNWAAADLRVQVTAALGLLGESFEAVAELVRMTASDPTSARPSRITAAGNPHLRAASTAMLIARADAFPEPAMPGLPHPDAHVFERSDYDGSCVRCTLPEANGRHRVPKPRNDRQQPYRPFQNPPDISAYHGDL